MFWLLLFGSTALVMLAVIEPKFAKRQERLERMSQSRGRAAQAVASGNTASDPSVYAESPRWHATQRPTLRPLIFFIALVLLAASLVMRFRAGRMPPRTSPSPDSAKPHHGEAAS